MNKSSLTVVTWDGFDCETGNYIEIDKADIPSVASGAIIDVYDNKDDQYHTVEIISVVKTSNKTIIEAFDRDENKDRTFDMEEIRPKAT